MDLLVVLADGLDVVVPSELLLLNFTLESLLLFHVGCGGVMESVAGHAYLFVGSALEICVNSNHILKLLIRDVAWVP